MLCIIQLDTVCPNAGVAEYTVSTREYCACREEMEEVQSQNGKQTELLLIKQMRAREICCICLTDCSVPSYHWVYERTKRVRARVKTPYWSSVGFNILTTSWKGFHRYCLLIHNLTLTSPACSWSHLLPWGLQNLGQLWCQHVYGRILGRHMHGVDDVCLRALHFCVWNSSVMNEHCLKT